MRLLFNQDWFEPISSEGNYESDFERLITTRAAPLFPGYHVIPFKIRVESEEGRRMPDLALVERRYRHWWVVEVEMAHHSLRGHVIPQVEVFARGKYGQEHCDYMAEKCGELDRVALTDMIKSAQPRVLVVVNQNVPDWIEPIRRLDGLVAIVEVFRSDKNQHILKIDGDYPTGGEDSVVTSCRLDTGFVRLLQVDSPAALSVANGEKVHIRFEGRLTDWSRMDASDRVWLIPSQRNPLTTNQEYLIVRESDGHLAFRKN